MSRQQQEQQQLYWLQTVPALQDHLTGSLAVIHAAAEPKIVTGMSL